MWFRAEKPEGSDPSRVLSIYATASASAGICWAPSRCFHMLFSAVVFIGSGLTIKLMREQILRLRDSVEDIIQNLDSPKDVTHEGGSLKGPETTTIHLEQVCYHREEWDTVKWDNHSCIWTTKLERAVPTLHAPGQSLPEGGVLVRLCVSESQKNCQMQADHHRWRGVGEWISDLLDGLTSTSFSTRLFANDKVDPKRDQTALRCCLSKTKAPATLLVLKQFHNETAAFQPVALALVKTTGWNASGSPHIGCPQTKAVKNKCYIHVCILNLNYDVSIYITIVFKFKCCLEQSRMLRVTMKSFALSSNFGHFRVRFWRTL